MSDDALTQNLRAIIDGRRQEMVEDLERHVAIPTGKNHTPGLDEYRGVVVDRLRAIGADAIEHAGEPKPEWLIEGGVSAEPPPTVVCRKDEPAEPRVMIAGHLDTVFSPEGSFREMSIAPDGKTAVGPGVVDMKGGILIAMVALESIAEAGLDIPWTFTLNSDEETGTYHSDSVLRAEAQRHRWGLALEPALPDGSLAVERKGSGQIKIETHGRSAHAGREFEKGVSAVYGLARVLLEVERLSDLERGVTVNVGPVQGGIATNVVPDHAALWANARYPSAELGDELGARVDALATGEGAMPGVSVRRSFNRPAKPLILETERLALAARDVAESIGQRLPFASTGGVCDGNNLQDAGLPTIDTLGVRGGGLHTHQEWIELDSLTERALLLARLIVRLDEGDC